MKSVFALIDCNNFFVSCERLFRPDLEGKPVVVLSSNDGCVVARSNEARVLGIPMAAPVFKYRYLFQEQGIVQFSANFELYGDISQRIIQLLTAITPRTEVYSVDESFLDLSELGIENYQQWGSRLRQRLLREVGVPVSIGIARTKTLAKLAAEHAKRDSGASGVLDLIQAPDNVRQTYLAQTPINDVWGVGRRLAPRLRAEGVHTALGLSELRPRLANQLMGVHGRQMVAELRGISCHQLEPFGKIRQSIMHGRQFGEDTSQFAIIEAAIASLTARAAARLRSEHLLARSAVVHLNTNRHKPGYQRTSRFISFATPTADTGHITSQLVAAAQAALNPQAQYHRANVLLYNLVGEQGLQTDLLGSLDVGAATAAQAKLQAFDAINARYDGQRTIRYAAEDLSNAWQPKRDYRGPRHTTNWQDLPIAQIL
ncbi:MAG TPA: Y-family DNA polymerase [Verrucomicrobiae bacterium]|jgi:DNA polymerase V|nr:Y-family DNA polymerase [Verrucomicrobiae bacterium]